MEIDALLNDFATRSFRDTADMDYIAARMSYRAGLVEQFHWQGLQALEKYLKAILLYNRVKAKRIGHDLTKALEKAKQLPFELELTTPALQLIEHLDKFGRFRYLEASYYIHGPKLVELDRTVWEIRRYCRVLNYKINNPDGSVTQMLPIELERIEKSKYVHPHKLRIIGGALEKILDKKDDAARGSLVWQNGFFGKKHRKTVTMRIPRQGKNSPLSLHPEMLDELKEYVYVSKEIIEAYSGQS
ncbi:HEPN domain-containing protein [Thiohalobacter thiocyanaticus]|uniref:HEPN domain-containing protein n=1 Tax=Thiohalobacter thiocyanaticus TaxID=585455 RepID=A0A426QKF2_9GAMM|nr:HEPN domain-containing protein [Thiohalobacter thiocyanaticus]RRQ22220.1 HEPN domain-containing protein [Thiohalobacter thiocyanaticus]